MLSVDTMADVVRGMDLASAHRTVSTYRVVGPGLVVVGAAHLDIVG